jgi:hypothetical protein
MHDVMHAEHPARDDPMNKITTLAAAFLLGTATFAAAQETTATENAFGLPQVQEDNLLIELPLVTATADGVVEIRGIAGEQEGEVFGSQPVTAGANENVQITLTTAPNASAVMAVLVVDGVDAAMQEVEMAPPGPDDGDDSDGDDEGESGNGDGEGGEDGGADDSNGG